MTKEQLKQYFIEKLGIPISEENLEEYLRICLLNKKADLTQQGEQYTEEHHILPRSMFPEYVGEPWNKVIVLYKTHCLLHEILWCAYPLIAEFWSPLRFMKSELEATRKKMAEAMSHISKKIWEDRKNNPEEYRLWCENRSNYMKKAMVKGTKSYDLMIKTVTDAAQDPKYKETKSSLMRDLWETPEHREKVLLGQKLWKEKPENKILMLETNRKLWANTEFRSKQKNAMKDVNNRPEKRLKNKETALNNWKNPEFSKKMLDGLAVRRLTRKSSSNAMKLLWSDPIKKAEMLAKRAETKRKNKGTSNETN